MGTLTGERHGDASNSLFAFYQTKARELEAAGQLFMAAVTLGFAVETALLTYLLVEFTEENGGPLEIPEEIGFSGLIQMANEIEVLSAPIDGPSQVREDAGDTPPKHIAKDVIDKIRKFRNLIHPAWAIAKSFDPVTFTIGQLQEYKDMHESVLHSLVYYI